MWLAIERPDILSIGPDGRRRAYGSRRHTSPTSHAYREEAARITAAMVERYGLHEPIVVWQLDNEPGNHDSARCWSDESQAAFSRWLSERFDGRGGGLDMAVVTGSKRRRLVERIGLYAALSAFGIVMVFPFAVVAFGSLKEAGDIFRFPAPAPAALQPGDRGDRR